MESLYYFEFCVVILSCCLKINKIKKKKKKKSLHVRPLCVEKCLINAA